jgi:murein DD-endopeptidase MepM/ murein hydrolase activator NlpD
MLRPLTVLLLVALAAALAVAGAQAAPPDPLPSYETPNGPRSVVVPFSISTPPVQPAQRSYAQLLALWQEAGGAYGVPWEVLGAINKIESNFGRNMGPSSAGALGWMQFMPDTWARWGMDGDGDGVANPWIPEDAVYAAARYLAAAGAHDDLYRAIFAYNHADWYVQDVLELAGVFAGGGGFDATLGTGALGFTGGGFAGGADAIFRISDLETRLGDARKDVKRYQERVSEVEKRLVELDSAVFEAEQRAGDPSLSDAEFQAMEGEVTALVLEQEAGLDLLAARRAKLAEAAQLLEDLRNAAEEQASAVTFSRSSAVDGLGAPHFFGQYVFPVGGGASVVSVGSDHHDYPAADIAAPEGSPLYALSDGVVVDTYTTPTGRCGIGFSMQIVDGRTFLYCHLSYLDPTVVSGSTLAAGTPVGLVGSTGNSTGPHLHLQLVPTDSYPQQEAWFQSFAGVAFRWQDEAPAPAATASDGVIPFSR